MVKLMAAGKELFTKLLASLKRFPEAMLLASAMVIVMIILNHQNYAGPTAFRDHLLKLAMVFALGIPLFLSIKLLFEKLPQMNRWLKAMLYLAVVIGLVLYELFGLKTLMMVPVTRYVAFSVAFYFLFLLTPYFYKRENFELYCAQLLTGLAITYFYTVVLYLGLSAMLFTISNLFLIKFGRIYFDVWLAAAGIFAPAYFLAGIPESQKEFQAEHFSKVLKILLLYILIPMFIVYAVILYVYFAKIVITRVWPAGIVSHLVLWYSLLVSAVLFIVYPLRQSIHWLAKILRHLPKIMLPLLVMMFLAVGIRIHAYGFTENRYFVLVAGLWVTGWMIYCLFTKKIHNIILPTTLAVIAILSVSGPWSAYSISKSSQTDRFGAILKQYNMLQGGQIIRPSQALPKKAQMEIIAILSYFQRSHSLRELKYLPQNFHIDQTGKIFGITVNKDILKYGSNFSYFNYEWTNNPKQPLLNIQGFDYFVKIPQTDIITTVPRKKMRISYSVENRSLLIEADGKEVYRKKVSGLAFPLFKGDGDPSHKALTRLDENDQVKVLYIFNRVSGRKDPITGQMDIDYLDFEVFIQLK